MIYARMAIYYTLGSMWYGDIFKSDEKTFTWHPLLCQFFTPSTIENIPYSLPGDSNIYLELEQNYAIYQTAKLGVANCWNKRNTVQKLGIQIEIDETFFHTVISLVYFVHWTNLSLIYGYFEGIYKLKTIFIGVFHSIYLLI